MAYRKLQFATDSAQSRSSSNMYIKHILRNIVCHRRILHQCTFGHYLMKNIRNICTNAKLTDQGHCFDVVHTLLVKLNSWHPFSQSLCVLVPARKKSILLPSQRYSSVHDIDTKIPSQYILANIDCVTL